MLENIMTSLSNIKNKREALLVLILFAALFNYMKLSEKVDLLQLEINEKNKTISKQDRNIDGLINSYATLLRNQQEIPLYEKLEPMLNSRFPNISTIIQDLRENKQNENNFKQLSANLNNYFNEFEYLRDSIERADKKKLTNKVRELQEKNKILQEKIKHLEEELFAVQEENNTLIEYLRKAKEQIVATTKHYTDRLFKEKQIKIEPPKLETIPEVPISSKKKPLTPKSPMNQLLSQDKADARKQYYRFDKPVNKKTKTIKIVIDEISQNLEKAIFENTKETSVPVKVKISRKKHGSLESQTTLHTNLSKQGLEMDISHLDKGEYEAKILYGTHSIIKNDTFKFSL